MIKKAVNCINADMLQLYKKTAERDQVASKVKAYLPEHLQDHVQINSFDKGILSLSATSQACLTELRYLLPDLRNKLRQQAHFYQLVNIQLSSR